MATFVAVIEDLFFVSRVDETARQVGAKVLFARTPEAIMELVRTERPGAVIVDLEASRLHPIQAIEALKHQPSSQQIPVIAYFPHVQTALRDAAQKAGCDLLMPRSEFSRRLPDLLAGHGRPGPDPAAGLLDLSDRGILDIRGTDRVRFLHGMTTNDVKGLAVGAGHYSTMVTRQGKMVADFKIKRLEDRLRLDMEPGLSRIVLEAMKKLIVTDDVQITEGNSAWTMLAVHGPGSAGIVQQVTGYDPRSMKEYHFTALTIEGSTLLVSRYDGLGEPGFEWHLPREIAGTITRKLEETGARPIGMDTVELWRIENGTPKWGVDMNSDYLPMEAGLDEKAISYTKGCYLGQEVIQRVKTYSEPPRRLVGITFEGASVPAHGDPILAGDEAIGHITSAVFSRALQTPVALGYVRKEHKTPGTSVSVQTPSGRINGSVTALPFVRKHHV